VAWDPLARGVGGDPLASEGEINRNWLGHRDKALLHDA
jgi:hypothetical protein